MREGFESSTFAANVCLRVDPMFTPFGARGALTIMSVMNRGSRGRQIGRGGGGGAGGTGSATGCTATRSSHTMVRRGRGRSRRARCGLRRLWEPGLMGGPPAGGHRSHRPPSSARAPCRSRRAGRRDGRNRSAPGAWQLARASRPLGRLRDDEARPAPGGRTAAPHCRLSCVPPLMARLSEAPPVASLPGRWFGRCSYGSLRTPGRLLACRNHHASRSHQ
jgi:hypothetical protein